jgi:integrase/recombinase XerD
MPFRKRRCGSLPGVDVLDARGLAVTVAGEFLLHLAACGFSPNTAVAYGGDLGRLWAFLDAHRLTWDELSPASACEFFLWLRSDAHRGCAGLPTGGDVRPIPQPRRLSPASVNRALSAVASFFDWAELAGRYVGPNPIRRVEDRTAFQAAERHRPFLEGIAKVRAITRVPRVKAVRRLPRPLPDDQVAALLGKLRSRRDLAMARLMLDGGLRPGEVLGLRLGDIAYGRRRVAVRHREDHPRGVRQKSRTERVVDVLEAATLEAVTAYILCERPREAATDVVFLVGGTGPRRCEALSYWALARLFARAAARAGIRSPGVTPHALRHTHATRMWDRGMRELTLQRRLGHASLESTRIYTRVSDRQVLEEYKRALGIDTGALPASVSVDGSEP